MKTHEQIRALFQDEGLTNYEGPDYSELVDAKKKVKALMAFCTSRKCCSQWSEGRYTPRVYRQGHKGLSNCKVCGDALLWKMAYIGKRGDLK